LRGASGPGLDPGDPDLGVGLAMALPAPVVLATLELHDDQLLVAALPHYLPEDARPAQPGRIHDGVALGAEIGLLAKLDRVALPGGEPFEPYNIAFANAVLLASRENHGFHRAASSE